MNRRADNNIGLIVVGAVMGVIFAVIVAIPFYGFVPLIVVIGALVVLAFMSRISGNYIE